MCYKSCLPCCSGGQSVNAASEGRSVLGAFLSSCAHVGETQGWQSYTDTFRLQVSKGASAFVWRWQWKPLTASRSLRWWWLHLVDLRDKNNCFRPVISVATGSKYVFPMSSSVCIFHCSWKENYAIPIFKQTNPNAELAGAWNLLWAKPIATLQTSLVQYLRCL